MRKVCILLYPVLKLDFYFIPVFQGAGARGRLIASSWTFMLRHHGPPGDRLPPAGALWSMATGCCVMAAHSQPTGA